MKLAVLKNPRTVNLTKMGCEFGWALLMELMLPLLVNYAQKPTCPSLQRTQPVGPTAFLHGFQQSPLLLQESL